MERCIHVFIKERESKNTIQAMRKKHDHLYNLIGPHITLVFPFESNWRRKTVVNHVRRFCKTEPFEVEINRMEVHDKFLFLMTGDGTDDLIQLHEDLYQGKMADFKDSSYGQYQPHVTVARFDSNAAAEAAYHELRLEKPLRFTVKEIAVEIIEEDQSSTIEYVHKLRSKDFVKNKQNKDKDDPNQDQDETSVSEPVEATNLEVDSVESKEEVKEDAEA